MNTVPHMGEGDGRGNVTLSYIVYVGTVGTGITYTIKKWRISADFRIKKTVPTCRI